jgi:hypothetical protein
VVVGEARGHVRGLGAGGLLLARSGNRHSSLLDVRAVLV